LIINGAENGGPENAGTPKKCGEPCKLDTANSVCPGSFGRTPPEIIEDSRTEFNRILRTSKSEAAVTSNKKTAL